MPKKKWSELSPMHRVFSEVFAAALEESKKAGRSLHRHHAECRGSSPELHCNYNAGKQ